MQKDITLIVTNPRNSEESIEIEVTYNTSSNTVEYWSSEENVEDIPYWLDYDLIQETLDEHLKSKSQNNGKETKTDPDN